MRKILDKQIVLLVRRDREWIGIEPAAIVGQIAPTALRVRAQIDDIAVTDEAPAHAPVRCVVTKMIKPAHCGPGQRASGKSCHSTRADPSGLRRVTGPSRSPAVERSQDESGCPRQYVS